MVRNLAFQTSYSAVIATATTAYTAKDLIGGKITIPNAVPYSGGGATLASISVSDEDDQKKALTVVFFTTAPALTFTDDSAFDPTDADIKNAFLVGITTTSYVSFNDNALSTTITNIPFRCSGTNLYAALVAVAAPDYTSTASLSITFNIVGS
jgi:hypothetical protein